jgi:hypothetical protein
VHSRPKTTFSRATKNKQGGEGVCILVDSEAWLSRGTALAEPGSKEDAIQNGTRVQAGLQGDELDEHSQQSRGQTMEGQRGSTPALEVLASNLEFYRNGSAHNHLATAGRILPK